MYLISSWPCLSCNSRISHFLLITSLSSPFSPEKTECRLSRDGMGEVSKCRWGCGETYSFSHCRLHSEAETNWRREKKQSTFSEIWSFVTTRSFYSGEVLRGSKGSQEFSFPETGQKTHEICPQFNFRNKEQLAPQSWEAGWKNDILFCFSSVEFYSLSMACIVCWVVTVGRMLDSETS